MKPYEKEGQVQGTVGATITLIVGVAVATLVLIFVGTLGGQTYTLVEDDIESLTTAVTNENTLVFNHTTSQLANTDIEPSGFTAYNGTNAVALSKITIDYDAGTVQMIDSTYNNTYINFSYSHGNYVIKDSIKASIMSSFDAVESTGSYLPIIVLAVIIVVVLGLVLGMSGLGGKNGGYSAL